MGVILSEVYGTIWFGTVLVIDYALSYGTWISFQFSIQIPYEIRCMGNEVFAPLEDAAMNGPAWLMDPYCAYLSLCSTSVGGPPLIYSHSW